MTDKDRNNWAGVPGREKNLVDLQVGRKFRLDSHLPCRHCGCYQTKDGRRP